MAETRETNIVVPEVFSAATVEPSIYRSALYRSGVITVDPMISEDISGGGKTYTLPFWNDISGTSGDIPLEGTDQTVNNMAMESQVYRKQYRVKAWGQNDLSKVLSGSNGLTEAENMVMDYWAQAYDIIGFKSMEGVIADNVANDSGDLVRDISGLAGSSAYISGNEVIKTTGLLGENQDVFAAVGMAPATYNYLKELDLIDFVKESAQGQEIPVYMGMRVIVSRNATTSGTTYFTYLMRANGMRSGITSANYVPTETDRLPLDGMGIDQLITRRVFTVHPVGTAWQESSVAGKSPTDTELATAANWDRVFEQENMPFVVLKHKLPS